VAGPTRGRGASAAASGPRLLLSGFFYTNSCGSQPRSTAPHPWCAPTHRARRHLPVACRLGGCSAARTAGPAGCHGCTRSGTGGGLGVLLATPQEQGKATSPRFTFVRRQTQSRCRVCPSCTGSRPGQPATAAQMQASARHSQGEQQGSAAKGAARTCTQPVKASGLPAVPPSLALLQGRLRSPPTWSRPQSAPAAWRTRLSAPPAAPR
jgi:hypothetical protein